MDKPIGVGDLVYVWKWHACGCGLGRTGPVVTMMEMAMHLCNTCNAQYPDHPHDGVPGLIMQAGTRWCVPVEWVRRIPPQEELEGKPTQEPIRAPTIEPEVIIELSRLMFPL